MALSNQWSRHSGGVRHTFLFVVGIRGLGIFEEQAGCLSRHVLPLRLAEPERSCKQYATCGRGSSMEPYVSSVVGASLFELEDVCRVPLIGQGCVTRKARTFENVQLQKTVSAVVPAGATRATDLFSCQRIRYADFTRNTETKKNEFFFCCSPLAVGPFPHLSFFKKDNLPKLLSPRPSPKSTYTLRAERSVSRTHERCAGNT